MCAPSREENQKGMRMKNMDSRNIYLKNEILDNKNLSANAISVYIALRSVYLNWKEEYYINPDLLYYELFQDGKVNRYAKDRKSVV